MFLFNHNRKYAINKKIFSIFNQSFYIYPTLNIMILLMYDVNIFSWICRPSWKLKHWKRNVPDLLTKDTTRRRTTLKTVNIQNNNNIQNDAPATIFFSLKINVPIKNLIYFCNCLTTYLLKIHIFKCLNFVWNVMSTLWQYANFIFLKKSTI